MGGGRELTYCCCCKVYQKNKGSPLKDGMDKTKKKYFLLCTVCVAVLFFYLCSCVSFNIYFFPLCLFLRRSLLPPAPRRGWGGQDSPADDHVSCRLQSVQDLSRHSWQAQETCPLSVNVLCLKFACLHDWYFEMEKRLRYSVPWQAGADFNPYEPQNIWKGSVDKC